MTSKTFDVPEVHCGHCVSSIEGAVSRLDGVDSVRVRLDERAVDVSYDESKVDAGAVVTAIEELGYAVAG